MPVWKLWGKVCTQWRAGDGLIGLDYPAVLRTAELYGVNVTPELFDGIRALESDVLAEQRERQKERMEEWQKRKKSKSN